MGERRQPCIMVLEVIVPAILVVQAVAALVTMALEWTGRRETCFSRLTYGRYAKYRPFFIEIK